MQEWSFEKTNLSFSCSHIISYTLFIMIFFHRSRNSFYKTTLLLCGLSSTTLPTAILHRLSDKVLLDQAAANNGRLDVNL